MVYLLRVKYVLYCLCFLQDDKFAVESSSVQTSDGWTDGNDGWTDDWNQPVVDDEIDSKEKRKADLQRKRDERKQQRELANKEKRAKSGGALKLGAVKKTTS